MNSKINPMKVKKLHRKVRIAAMLFILMTAIIPAFSQNGVGINPTGAAADPSAMLDVSSTTKGILIPRMTAAQRAALVLPATGLMVYQTDGSAGYYFNTGTPVTPGWILVNDAAALTGTVPVASGGTGATTAAGARGNIGAASSGANADITSLTGLVTPIAVDGGGTGTSYLTAGYLKGNGASPFTTVSTIPGSDVTGSISGNATNFTGSLSGDVSGTQTTTSVDIVGGVTSTNVASGTNAANAATDANTASTIVKRDASGNFSAGTITGALNGNATTATSATSSGSATNFTGSLSGDVSGNQTTTSVDIVGGVTSTNVASGANAANAATNANTANTIVKRDASGNFSIGTITGALNGNATTATSAGSFSGSLSGDVTGIQSATTVANVGGTTAANVASGANAANAATNANTASTIVKRDASGNFSIGTITGALNGNAATATSAGSFSGSLSGDVTGTQSATTIANNAVTSAKILDGTISDADVNAAAAIAYSKLALTGSIVNADIANVAAGKITSGTLALNRGGTNANLNATGGTGQYLQQSAAGAAITVGTIPAADLSAILSSTTPSPLGTAAVGVATTAARADHVHAAINLGTGAGTTFTGILPTANGGTNGAFVAGSFATITTSTAFISTTASVTVTAGQKIVMFITQALGCGATAATGLNIYPAYKLSSGSLTVIGGGQFGLTCPANQRLTYCVSGVTPALAAGTYTIGMAGSAITVAPWNANSEWGYVTYYIIN